MSKKAHTVRIIAGKYKHKNLPVLDLAGLRPTPDLVRETIFNWLGSQIENACVLDLFAGSGVLGFEAISRGAKQLYSIEKNPQAAANLRELASQFSEPVLVINQNAEEFLLQATGPFDLVFLDPPYASDLLTKCLPLLLQRNLLKDSSLLYVEMQASNHIVVPGYQIIRELTQGQVKYALWQKNALW
ncbi:MAG: 16S rRNA (guanine(966)-N(2))-methyltransferase RsmD [Succinivibrio sp.]|nr:16S rRNA (guanine(966)-N(2))-methyltransferase RsmD [Succinivibrio sp.]